MKNINEIEVSQFKETMSSYRVLSVKHVEIIMSRRQELDHNRYMANREERKAKQREYYQSHRERYQFLYRCRLEKAYLKLKSR